MTAEQVWEALAEIPDPEIPVVSLVDLGVIKAGAVEERTVRIDFTPTFMGCPALEVMRHAMEAKVAALGATPEVRVVLDDSWSTDRISPEGREKLREADLTKHLTDINKEKEEEKAKATERAAVQYNFTPAPRPKDIDEKAMRPEPGEIVSKNDYELNQALAFLKTRTLAKAN